MVEIIRECFSCVACGYENANCVWQDDYYHTECLSKCENCNTTFKKLDDESLCLACKIQIQKWFNSEEYQRELRIWKNEEQRQQQEIYNRYWIKLTAPKESKLDWIYSIGYPEHFFRGSQ